MIGIYNSDMGRYDGLTRGKEYWLEEDVSGDQYLIKKNDLGGSSHIKKDKFELVEPLVIAAEKAIKGE